MTTKPQMRLHWSPRSPFVRKVMIAAHELGLADQIETMRTRVAMNEVHRGLLSDNPIGKIPTLLLADGTILYDSLVICEYLDSIAPGRRIFPAAGPKRFEALRRHALGNGYLDMLILWRFEGTRPTPSSGMVEGFQAKHVATLDALEAEVPALTKDDFGIGHIAIACALSYLDFRFDALKWRDGHPALAAWHAAAAARPSFVATTVVDD